MLGFALLPLLESAGLGVDEPELEDALSLSFLFRSAEPEGGVALDPEADEDPDGVDGVVALEDPVAELLLSARAALGPEPGLSQP